jgi:transposase-like protein
MALEFSLRKTPPPFAYQRIAREAARLHRLGMPATAIARILEVTDKTVAKAIRVRWLEAD